METTISRRGEDRAMIKEMATGIFSCFSLVPMLVTHRADTQMHMHMTSLAFPAILSSHLQQIVNDALQSFTHPGRSLVMDIGCGRGSFLLGLACRDTPPIAVNYLGIERSPYLTAKGRGMAKRLGVDGVITFVSGPVEEILNCLLRHKDKPRVAMCCCMFPTPFAAQQKTDDATAPVPSNTTHTTGNTATHVVKTDTNTTTTTTTGFADNARDNTGTDDTSTTNTPAANTSTNHTDNATKCDTNTTDTLPTDKNTSASATAVLAPSLLSDAQTRNMHLPTTQEFILSETVVDVLARLLEPTGGIFVQVCEVLCCLCV